MGAVGIMSHHVPTKIAPTAQQMLLIIIVITQLFNYLIEIYSKNIENI